MPLSSTLEACGASSSCREGLGATPGRVPHQFLAMVVRFPRQGVEGVGGDVSRRHRADRTGDDLLQGPSGQVDSHVSRHHSL